jgi:hypothetical protein
MSPAERAAVRKRLEDIRKEILAGADFDAMARQHSQSSDSQSGGWSGLKRGDKIFESFSDVAFGMKVDEVSQVVDTPTGFHLIKLKEKSPAKTRTFEEMKEFARQHAVTAKQEALQEAFLQEYGKKYGLVRSYERLEDPMIQDDTPLVTVGSSSLTMRQLVDRLPPPLLEHLFNLYFPTIHRFLDGIAVEEVLIQEAEARGIGKRPAIVETVRVATEEVKSRGGARGPAEEEGGGAAGAGAARLLQAEREAVPDAADLGPRRDPAEADAEGELLAGAESARRRWPSGSRPARTSPRWPGSTLNTTRPARAAA